MDLPIQKWACELLVVYFKAFSLVSQHFCTQIMGDSPVPSLNCCLSFSFPFDNVRMLIIGVAFYQKKFLAFINCQKYRTSPVFWSWVLYTNILPVCLPGSEQALTKFASIILSKIGSKVNKQFCQQNGLSILPMKQNRQLCSVPANHPRIGASAPFSDRRFNVSHGRIHVLLEIYGQGTSIFRLSEEELTVSHVTVQQSFHFS